MGIPVPQGLSVAQQFNALRGNPVCTGTGTLQRGQLTWNYDAQPTPLSRVYTVRVRYKLGSHPEIIVRRPHLLSLAEDRRLPHVYCQDPPRLCLFLPGRGEWSRFMRLDETIVPWTATWLYFFEDWLDTNEWKGGGQHPTSANRPLPNEPPRNAKGLQ